MEDIKITFILVNLNYTVLKQIEAYQIINQISG